MRSGRRTSFSISVTASCSGCAAVDPLKLLLPESWKSMPYFSKMSQLKGVPVVNIHM
jgi:uncharacterized protein with NAD-binding domain and iron-sulfur cluster